MLASLSLDADHRLPIMSSSIVECPYCQVRLKSCLVPLNVHSRLLACRLSALQSAVPVALHRVSATGGDLQGTSMLLRRVHPWEHVKSYEDEERFDDISVDGSEKDRSTCDKSMDKRPSSNGKAKVKRKGKGKVDAKFQIAIGDDFAALHKKIDYTGFTSLDNQASSPGRPDMDFEANSGNGNFPQLPELPPVGEESGHFVSASCTSVFTVIAGVPCHNTTLNLLGRACRRRMATGEMFCFPMKRTSFQKDFAARLGQGIQPGEQTL